MKKIILLIAWCGIMGEVRGQGVDRNVINCPGDMWIYGDTWAPLYLDMPSSFFYGCNGFPNAGGETVYHFTAPCTCTYTLEYTDYNGTISVSYRSYYWDYCDSTGYSCLNPLYVGNDKYKIDMALDSTLSYDFLFENSDTTNYGSSLIMKEPHITNIQFYDISSNAVSVSWEGLFDDMVIEYGNKGFIPGNDTLPGIGGTIVHNPASPHTFTGLIPDSVYDFYFRDKCGVFSANSTRFRKRIPNCSNLPSLNCNTFFNFILYTDTAYFDASWVMDSCGNSTHLSQEKIFTFTSDTTGIFSFEHYSGSCSNIEIGIYYKESSLGCDEHNWICIGAGSNAYTWNASFGPLIAGTNYNIMFKSNPHYCGPITTGFRFNCPSAACSVAPYSISTNTTNDTICSNQSVTLTQLGGVLSINGAFHWYADSCGGTSLGTGYSKTFSPAITTTYYVRAEDTCGVTACASITINVNPSPAPPTITGFTTFCQGSSTVLNPGNGYWCYQWSNGATTQTISVSTAGTYTVTVCGTSGCTTSASVTVTVLPLPTAVITGTASICAGQSTNLTIVFTGTGPWNYSYTAPSGVVNATTPVSPVVISVSPSVTFNYTLVSVNDPVCVGTVSGNATITVYPLPTATLTGNASICAGSCTNITFLFTGTPPFTFYYNDGTTVFGPFTTSNTTATITVCPPVTRTYTLVSVSDSHCAGIVSGFVIITVNPLPNPVISGQAYFCPGSNTVLDAGPLYSSYAWSTSSASQTIIVGVAGVYTVWVTDANGCIGSDSATVTALPNPPVSLTPSSNINICLGDTVHFTATAGAGYTYQWFKHSIPVPGATNSFYDATLSAFYSCRVTDSNSCDSTSAAVKVTIICLPPLDDQLRKSGDVFDDIVIIPNPAKKEITIFNLPEETEITIEIFSVIGEKVYAQPGTLKLKQETKIDISNFSKGVYFVTVDNGKEKTVKKFLKE